MVGLGNKGSSHLNTNINFICPFEVSKEGKPHGTKPSLKNGHGAKTCNKWQQSPSITHSKKISQVSEGLLYESIGENVDSLLGGWAILQGNHSVMH